MEKIINFGCRLNIYEGQVISDSMEKINNSDDFIILNSCAVTSQAEKKLRVKINNIIKNYPNKKLVVTGCAAQINPRKYASIKGVYKVIGNQEKLNISEHLHDNEKNGNGISFSIDKKSENLNHKDKIFFQKNGFFDERKEENILVNDIMSVKSTASHLISSFKEHTRAFVQIQNGCNHRCTFCIIPFARGNSRSVPFGRIVEQVRALILNGYKEIVFTGIDITDYGKDLFPKITLAKMIKRLLKLVPEIVRLRLSSIDVSEIDEELTDLIIYEKKLMPYIHISLQSGDDMILKRMGRRHNRKQILDFCNFVSSKRKDIAFGGDIIVGFPTETNIMFENSLKLISEANLVFNHIFPYSKRDGTPSSKMPQIESQIIKNRAKILREQTEKQLYNYLDKYRGENISILTEGKNLGKSENFMNIKIKNADIDKGQILDVKVFKRHNDLLLANIL